MQLPDDARFSTVCIHAGQDTRPDDGRRHHADLSDVHVRAGGARPAQGLRVRADAEPDARGARGQPRGDRSAAGPASRSPRAWRRSTRSPRCSSSGDHVIVTDNTYGGTFRLFDKVLTRYGLTFSYVDTSQLDQIEAAITPQTRMLFVETPTNPVLRLTDLAAAAAIARAARHRAGRRQHVREPQRAAAHRARRRPGHPQHDEISERPQRQRRRHRHRGPGRAHRGAQLHPERGRRDPRARSTRGWCCAAPRRSPSAWPSTTRTAWRWRSTCRVTRGSSRSSIRAFRITRSTSWRNGRCAASAGW